MLPGTPLPFRDHVTGYGSAESCQVKLPGAGYLSSDMHSNAVMQSPPESSSREEIVRELMSHFMVQRGLADADVGRSIPNEEMGRRIRSWRGSARPDHEKR
jgi:predicted transcriptional regulator